MKTLFDELAALLKQDARFWADDQLLKNQVIEHALKLDKDLLKLLLSHPRLKEHFFAVVYPETDRRVDGVLVFDREKFIRFVNNKAFLPDSYTSFKNKIGLMTEDGHYLSESREVVLAWPYKDCVLEGGQTKEDQKRDEIFWNTILAPDEIDRLFEPKALGNWKRYDAEGEHPVTEIRETDNLIVKGNNLLALHSLKKRFAGKVKLIYIDPPYNTENDSFSYNDKFSHSAWLTFMRNRLEISKDLLKPDGVIFIQIDNREGHYLKVLCDEVFGRDCFRNAIIVKKGTKSLQKQFDSIMRLNAGYDTILLYSKSPDASLPPLFKKLGNRKSSSWNNHWRGTNRPTMRYELFGITPSTGQWRWSKERTYRAVANYEKLIAYIKEHGINDIDDAVIDEYYSKYIQEHGLLDYKDFELVRLSKTGNPEHYIPASDKILLSENWMDLSVAGRVTGFEHEKKEDILKRIIEWTTSENDIVLDFFLGSGTTAAVAHKMGRRYIGIEQMDYIETIIVERLKKVIAGEQGGISKAVNWQGGGSFVYCELMQWNGRFVERVQAAESKATLQAIWEEMQEKASLSYRLDIRKFNEHTAAFANLSLGEQKRFLLEILDANQLYVNLSEIEDKSYGIPEEVIFINKQFYHL